MMNAWTIINDQGGMYIIVVLILMGIEEESHLLNLLVIVANDNILNLNYQ